MANIMMPTIVAPALPNAAVDLKAQVPTGNSEGSFVQHLQREVKASQVEKDNLLGAQETREASSAPASKTDDGPTKPPATVEALLQQLMIDLTAMAKKTTTEPGQWSFEVSDTGVLDKLAAQAGMDVTTLTALKKQMKEEGSLPLADLFTALQKNFKELAAANKVTVAETYLPVLETLLSKLKVAQETIRQLDGQGVNGVDQLDLAAYAKGLQAIPAVAKGQETPAVVLSDYELEQVRAMLTEAGVPASQIAAMFPEQASLQQKALGLRSELSDRPVTMTLDRLTNILQQAVAAVGEAKPKVDPPAFLQELKTILSEAGFQGQGVGWSPVVQGSMNEAYQRLQEMVDLALVKVEKGPDTEMMRQLRQEVMTTVSPEKAQTDDLRQAVQQALAALDQQGQDQGQPLADIVAQVKAELARVGETNPNVGQIVATLDKALASDVVPTLETVRQALQQAAAELDQAQTKSAPPPSMFDAAMAAVTDDHAPVLSPFGQQMAEWKKGGEEHRLETLAQNEAMDKEGLASADKAIPATTATLKSGLGNGSTGGESMADDAGGMGPGGSQEGTASTDDLMPAATGIDPRTQAQAQVAGNGKVLAPRLHFTPELQQFASEQIAQGVLRGLRNNEHHLTLTLYPKEFGEVKVDMQVRGGQLAVSFVMENQKVKEALEANMDDFKDNLERRGFSLGAMSVSVDQHNNPQDGGKRFMAPWQQTPAGQYRGGKILTQAGGTPGISGPQTSNGQGGISLFV